MFFEPSNQLNIISEEEFPEKILEIEKILSECGVTGTITSFDGTILAYEYFTVENSRGSVVLIHGFTEFYKKMYEMAWYLLNMGYNVFMYDQRGHGHSSRKVENLYLTHVDNFNEYRKDLDYIINKVVIPAAPDKTIHLIGHSMGGAVAALYLKDNGNKIGRVVLSSPMISPKTHSVPGTVVRLVSAFYARIYGWKSRFAHSATTFNPNPNFHFSSDSSYARFRHNMDLRNDDLYYQNSNFTNRWIHEAMKVKKHLLSNNFVRKIENEILIISAEKDFVVHTRPQRRFAKMLPHCKMITVPGSKHTIYSGKEPMLKFFYTNVIEFLNGCELNQQHSN